MTTVSALGAIIALAVAIFLILKKVSPVYGMLAGALIGGLIGGADLTQTVTLMIGRRARDYYRSNCVFWLPVCLAGVLI